MMTITHSTKNLKHMFECMAITHTTKNIKENVVTDDDYYSQH